MSEDPRWETVRAALENWMPSESRGPSDPTSIAVEVRAAALFALDALRAELAEVAAERDAANAVLATTTDGGATVEWMKQRDALRARITELERVARYAYDAQFEGWYEEERPTFDEWLASNEEAATTTDPTPENAKPAS